MALLEERRLKLAAEGLFDETLKKPLPYLPRVIAVVTSPTGAVIRDILHRLAERFPTRVVIWPVRVQGETAPAEVTRNRLSDLRHDLLHIRRTLSPTRDAVRRVVDNVIEVSEGQEVFPHDVEIAFNSAYDKLLRAFDGLELSRDLIASVRDYLQAKIANDQNEVMKTLTVIASLLLLPTFIVGLYGQNFQHHFPEIHWQFGYLWSWALIVVTTIGQLIFFRRKKWI